MYNITILDNYLHFRLLEKMQTSSSILQMKYARIVKLFAGQANLTYEKVLDKFYDSVTYDIISNGIADMRCFSDEYLVDEEYGYKCDADV